MKLRKGMTVKHVDAESHASHYGTVMIARHSKDRYMIRWSGTLKNGEPMFWIQEHSRMALKPF